MIPHCGGLCGLRITPVAQVCLHRKSKILAGGFAGWYRPLPESASPRCIELRHVTFSSTEPFIIGHLRQDVILDRHLLQSVPFRTGLDIRLQYRRVRIFRMPKAVSGRARRNRRKEGGTIRRAGRRRPKVFEAAIGRNFVAKEQTEIGS